MKRILPLLQFLIGWPFTILAFFFILKIIITHWGNISSLLRNFNVILLTFGVICFIGYFFLRSVVWRELLRLKGHTLSLKEISYYWAFTEIKRYIPGNIWAFLSRAHILSEKNVSFKTTFSLTIIEAEFVSIASLLVSLLSLNFIVYGLLPDFGYKLAVIVLITVLTIIGIILFIGNTYFLKNPSGKLSEGLQTLLPRYNFYSNTKLLLLKATAMFLFGLGTYFALSSITRLYLPDVLTFIGFFVFSLLAGYLSLITPMGLGVREAVMTFGLSKFIPLSLAGFMAIFARIIFIITEVLFLAITYIWHNSKNQVVEDLESFIQTHRYEITLACAIFLYILYFTTASFLRYDNFFTGRFDLGNMDQTVWNTLHGRIFQSTDPNGTDIISRLAFHADFILILLAPFYFLWQDPKMLLITQTLVLATGAIFVYLIAQTILYKKPISLIVAVAFLFNPGVEFTNLYDFHGVTLATTLLLGAWYFLKTKRYFWLCIFLILSGLTKEEVWIITAIFGFYIFFSEKKKLLGTAIFVASAVVFSFLVFYAIPHTRGSAHFALSYYSDFGSSPKEIFKNLVFNPVKTVPVFFQRSQLFYIFQLVAPLGFLSFFTPLVLLFISPELIADLLASNTSVHQIYYQYSAAITPFIFISAVYSIAWLQKRLPKKFLSFIPYYVCMATIFAAYSYGPFPGAKNPSVNMFTSPQPYRNVISNFIASIPKQYDIAATNNLGSHLSRRQKIFTVPVGIDRADIILFLLNDPFAQPSLASQKAFVASMKRDKNYIEIFKLGDFVVFEKRNLYVHAEPVTGHVKLFPVSIPALQDRDFVGGPVKIEREITSNATFTSFLMSYPSDGLKIYALLNIPNASPSAWGFPVVILNHNVYRKNYSTENSFKSIADYFASHGFLVIKPDYRGNGNSEDDTSLPRTLSYPVDILNLISSLPGIRQADPQNVFLWGHSVGATVTLTSVEAYDGNRNFLYPLKGAAVWAPVTDPYLGYVRLRGNTTDKHIPYEKVIQRLGTPKQNPILWQSLSPLYYIDDIKTPIEINQGIADTVIPYQWSLELYDDLLSFNTSATLLLYPNEDHSFSHVSEAALADNVRFFRKLLTNIK